MKDDVDILELSEFYKVFGDPTRLKILISLMESDKYVGEIAEKIDISPSAVSHQLQLLRASTLIGYEKSGLNVKYFIKDDHIKSIINLGVEHLLERNTKWKSILILIY